jgi:hypothetical protein
VTSSIGRSDQTAGEGASGGDGVESEWYCKVEETCLKGEGEGCQASERGCGAARSEVCVSR